MHRLPYGLLALAALLLVGCAASPRSGLSSAAGASPSPERPGTRITFRNPDPSKWVKVQVRPSQPPPPGTNTHYFVCRPMACADKAGVSLQTASSPTRNPDKKALEKAAKLLATQARADDMMAEAASEGDVRITPLASRVTEVRGYPAIVAETRRTSLGKATYTVRGELFIGYFLVRLMSHSTDRAEAKRHFDSFVTSWDILDVPAGTEPSPSAATPVALDEAAATPAAAAQ